MTTAMACELANAHAPYMQVRRRSHVHDGPRAPCDDLHPVLQAALASMQGPGNQQTVGVFD